MAKDLTNEPDSTEDVRENLEEVAEREIADAAATSLPPNWRDGLTAEEITTMEALLSKTQFYAHAIALDTKANKKKAQGETILTEEGTYASTSDPHTADMLELTASAATKGKRLLKGVITGCISAGENGAATNMATVRYGNGTCIVKIPDYALFNYDVTVNRNPEQQLKLARRITNMIGVEISFGCVHFDQKTNTAYGDRLKALEQRGYENYVKHGSQDRPSAYAGKIVEGRITAIGRDYLVVDALGSESIIYQNKDSAEVSWRYLFDLRQHYHVNQIVKCKVMDVKRFKVKKFDNEYDLVATALSIKRTTENPQVKNFGLYKEGSTTLATISMVSSDLENMYAVINDGTDQAVNCMVKYPQRGDIPRIGDNVIVRIAKMETATDKGKTVESDGSPVRRIYCTLIHTLD